MALLHLLLDKYPWERHEPLHSSSYRLNCTTTVLLAREIIHVAAQSVHKYVWHVKWDQGERNGRLGRSNSHPPDCESCLASGLPTCWRTCKLPHCAIDPYVAFWYNYLSPACMHWGREAFWVLVTHHKRWAWM